MSFLFRGKKASQGEKRPLAISEKICWHLIFAAVGALIGSAELFFGVRPFGIALAAVSYEYMPAVVCGMMIYSFLIKDYVTPVALLALLALRLAISALTVRRDEKFRPFAERHGYRITVSAVVMLGVGVYTLLMGEFRYYDLFGTLLATLATPIAALLYLGVCEEREDVPAYRFEAGVAALVLTGIFALREISFFGIYPAAVAAAGVAFLMAAHRGIYYGCICGAAAGLCFDWRLSPAFLLAGLCFSLLEKSSRGGGILAGGAAASAYAFLLYQKHGLMSLLPSLLTAGALFLAFDSAGLVEGAPARRLLLARRRAAAQSAKAEEHATGESQLLDLSGALLDLSGTFYEIGSRLRRPARADLRRLCDKAFDAVCPSCRHRDICWGSEYQATAKSVKELSNRLYSHGTVGTAQMPEKLVARCDELGGILARVNHGAATLSEEALRGDKTSVVAMDYAAAGRAISEAIEENRENFVCDIVTGERVYEKLSRMGYVLESAVLCGKTRRRVILRGVRLPGRSLKIRELRDVIERICHFPLGVPKTVPHEGVTDIVFAERVALAVSSVKLTRPKGKGEGKHCGDSVTAISVENGLDYTFICDGMGSGTGAALTSTLASVFLTRLLQAGGKADSSLRMLNGFMAARGQRGAESSTTVDLLEINRVNGAAALFKCGAAPTYLLRDGEVSRFFSRTAPVGILEALDAERISFTVETGDVLIQISDGFTGGEEDCPWLADMLKHKWDGDAENFARMALNRATRGSADDLSIIITEIKKAAVDTMEAAA